MIIRFLIGTYDLQGAYITSNGSGTINITGVFVNNSLARGYFVVDINENGNPEQFVAVIDHITKNQISSLLTHASKGAHRIVIFDIEADGFPGETAAVDSLVIVTRGQKPFQGKRSNSHLYNEYYETLCCTLSTLQSQ